jgi:hypothetical protein
MVKHHLTSFNYKVFSPLAMGVITIVIVLAVKFRCFHGGTCPTCDPPGSIRWCWAFPTAVLARVQQSHSRPEAEAEPVGNFTLVFDISHNNMISVHWRDVPEISKSKPTFSWFYVAISCLNRTHTLETQGEHPAPRPSPIAMNETVFEHKHASLLSCWVVCFTLFCSNMFKPWDKEPPLARQCLALGGSNLWQLFPDCNGPHGLFFVARHWRFLRSNILNVCFNETHFGRGQGFNLSR